MDKTTALKRLTSLENEAKELRKIIEEPEKPKNIMEVVTSFESACEVLGINPNSAFNCTDAKDEIAYRKLKIIARALNSGWTPNWDDSNEYKYYPYFDMRKGFGFSGTDYVAWLALASCGSRLCFKSRELAEYAGRTFTDIYKDLLTIQK